MKSRVDVEIACLRQMLTTVALRKFPWNNIPAWRTREETGRIAKRLRQKFQEKARLQALAAKK